MNSYFRKKTSESHEHEQKEVERLVRKSPPKKPPRIDKERRRIEVKDPDLDQKDPDLSMNYKDIGGSVSNRYLKAFGLDPDPDVEISITEGGGEEENEEEGEISDLDFEGEGEYAFEEEEDVEDEIEPPTRPPSDTKIRTEAERLYRKTVPEIYEKMREEGRTEAEKEALQYALTLKTKPLPPKWKMEEVFEEGLLTLKARQQLRKHMANWDARSFLRNLNYIKERQLNESLTTGRQDSHRYYEVILEDMSQAWLEFQEEDMPPFQSLGEMESLLEQKEDLIGRLKRTGVKVLEQLREEIKTKIKEEEKEGTEKLEQMLNLLRGVIMTRNFQKVSQYRGKYQYHSTERRYEKKDALDLTLEDYVYILRRACEYLGQPYLQNDLLLYDEDMACRIALDYAIFEGGTYDKKVDSPTYDALLGIMKRFVKKE